MHPPLIPALLARLMRRSLARVSSTHPDIDSLRERVEIIRDLPVHVADAPETVYDLYRPAGTGPGDALPVLIWWHGGGFIGGTKDAPGDLATVVASEGYAVVSATYAFAPEHTYPTPVLQARATITAVLEDADHWGLDPARVVLGGDSAGSGIASQVVAIETSSRLQDRMGLHPVIASGHLVGHVGYCGAHDIPTLGESGFPWVRTLLWAYTGRRDWSSFERLDEMSSVLWVTDDWPAAYVSCGRADPLFAQVRAFADALEEAGVDVTRTFPTNPDLGHEFELELDQLPGLDSLERTLRFLARVTGGPPQGEPDLHPQRRAGSGQVGGRLRSACRTRTG